MVEVTTGEIIGYSLSVAFGVLSLIQFIRASDFKNKMKEIQNPILQGSFGVLDDLVIREKRVNEKLIDFEGTEFDDPKVLRYIFTEFAKEVISYMKDFRSNLASEIRTLASEFGHMPENEILRLRMKALDEEVVKAEQS